MILLYGRTSGSTPSPRGIVGTKKVGVADTAPADGLTLEFGDVSTPLSRATTRGGGTPLRAQAASGGTARKGKVRWRTGFQSTPRHAYNLRVYAYIIMFTGTYSTAFNMPIADKRPLEITILS